MRSHLLRSLCSWWRQAKKLDPRQLQERLHQKAPLLVLDMRTNDEFIGRGRPRRAALTFACS